MQNSGTKIVIVSRSSCTVRITLLGFSVVSLKLWTPNVDCGPVASKQQNGYAGNVVDKESSTI